MLTVRKEKDGSMGSLIFHSINWSKWVKKPSTSLYRLSNLSKQKEPHKYFSSWIGKNTARRKNGDETDLSGANNTVTFTYGWQNLLLRVLRESISLPGGKENEILSNCLKDVQNCGENSFFEEGLPLPEKEIRSLASESTASVRNNRFQDIPKIRTFTYLKSIRADLTSSTLLMQLRNSS